MTRVSTITSIDVELLSHLFDQAPDVAFFVKDSRGNYVTVNESLIRRHGLKSKSEAIGKRPDEICPGDFGRVPADQDAKILRMGSSLIDHLEMQWQRPHEPVWCLTTKLPIRNAQGIVTGVVGFSRDLRIPLASKEIPAEFAQSLELFEQNLSEFVTPAILARQASMTSQRFARLTKRLFGLSPSQLITKTRIAAASQQLLESQQSILNIAIACGFYDHSAFARAFRSATGVSPSKYRAQSRRQLA